MDFPSPPIPTMPDLDQAPGSSESEERLVYRKFLNHLTAINTIPPGQVQERQAEMLRALKDLGTALFDLS